jgi:hypothetical protein
MWILVCLVGDNIVISQNMIDFGVIMLHEKYSLEHPTHKR